MEPRKQAILEALARFMNQRSGIEFGNYGDVKAFRAEQRSIYTDLKQARVLLAAVKYADGIDADALLKASVTAFGGRLTIIAKHADPKHQVARVEYVTGQYFPTEYRRAVCAVLASALWDYTREHCSPRGTERERCSPRGTERERFKQHGSATDLPMRTEKQWKLGDKWMSPGDWLRAHFRREFGRTIAGRWFS